MVVFSIDFYLFESSHNLFLCQNVSNVICINVFTHFPVIPLTNVIIRHQALFNFVNSLVFVCYSPTEVFYI